MQSPIQRIYRKRLSRRFGLTSHLDARLIGCTKIGPTQSLLSNLPMYPSDHEHYRDKLRQKSQIPGSLVNPSSPVKKKSSATNSFFAKLRRILTSIPMPRRNQQHDRQLECAGLDAVCDGGLAFINCTHQMLLKDYFLLLPPDKIVIEIQETVPADEIVLSACQRLRQKRYRLALDNFVPSDPRESLASYVNFIKVDIRKFRLRRKCSLRQEVTLVRKFAWWRKRSKTGCRCLPPPGRLLLFQGYFFRRPEHMRARHIPANQADQLRLLQAVSGPKLDLRCRRRPHQAQCVAVLSPVALSEFPVARAVIARSIDPPRHLSFGRARTGSLDSHGDNPRDGSGKMFGPRLVVSRPRPLLRVDRSQGGAREFRPFPHGNAFHDGRHPRSSHGSCVEGLPLDPNTKEELMNAKIGHEPRSRPSTSSCWRERPGSGKT